MPDASPLSILVLNQKWFVEELRELGHRVVSAGRERKDFDLQLPRAGMSILEVEELLPRGFKPDRLIYYDDSGPVVMSGFEDIHYPTLYYSIDAHHHSSWQRYFGACFDKVFVAQKDFLSDFRELNANADWLPLWTPIEAEPLPKKEIDVSFRGNLSARLHPRRASFFENLANLIDIDAKGGDSLEAYSNSKIVVNQVVDGDLNFRVFEAMICGALLITPEIENGLRDLFEPGEDLITYRPEDAEDAALKVKYYLEREDDLSRIASNGREKVLAQHSTAARAKAIENTLLSLKVSEREKANLGLAVSYLCASSIVKKHSDVFSEMILSWATDRLLASVARGENEDSALMEQFFCAES